jgi:hypothetical protein
MIMILLMSCNESVTKLKNNKGDDIDVVELKPKIKINIITENRFAYIKELENSNSELFVKVDYVDYLTGKEASEAEWRDEAYFIDGNDTISNITDGYYISNISPKFRTFRLKEKISVAHIIDNNGTQKLLKTKPLDSKQILSYIKNETLLFLYIKDGVIERIDELFLP